MRMSPLAILIAACGSVFIGSAASAASDYLLKIKGVDGEVEGKSADGQVEVSSYSWGVSQTAVSAPRDSASGQASGKRQHKPLTVISPDASAATARAAAPEPTGEKTLSIIVPEPGNETTAQLVRLCASGKHIKMVELTGSNTRYVLEDAVVSSCVVSGNQRKVEFRGHVTLMK